MADLGAASREFTFRSNVLGAWDAYRIAAIDAAFAADESLIDAEHDYRIADIDAVIAGLTAVRDHYYSDAIQAARTEAAVSRQPRVAAINAARAEAQQARRDQQQLAQQKQADQHAEAERSAKDRLRVLWLSRRHGDTVGHWGPS
jgi:hypothetical protein